MCKASNLLVTLVQDIKKKMYGGCPSQSELEDFGNDQRYKNI